MKDLRHVKQRIDSMCLADLPEVLSIEQESPAGWTMQQFVDEFEQPGAFQYVVRERETQAIKGFLCGRRVDDEAEILKLAIKKQDRRQGTGGFLLKYTLSELANQGVRTCFLELRSANTAALHLYDAAGFTQAGTRKDYYSSPADNALLMMKRL